MGYCGLIMHGLSHHKFLPPAQHSVAMWYVFGSLRLCVSVCLDVHQHDNFWTVWDIKMNFLWERDTVKSLDELENSCIPMHCSTRDTGGDLTF